MQAAAKIAPETVLLLFVTRIDHVKALRHFAQHPVRFPCRVLKIVIHNHDAVSVRMVQARHHRVVFTEILGEKDTPDSIRIPLVQTAAHISRAIRAPVIHQHDLQPPGTRKLCDELLAKTLNSRLRVVHGDDDGGSQLLGPAILQN